jgi:hypothetical protein
MIFNAHLEYLTTIWCIYGYLVYFVYLVYIWCIYGHLVYIFCRHFVYFELIWYILHVLVCLNRINLATLIRFLYT